MGAEQMRRDGICKLRVWSKPKVIGCASYQVPVVPPFCGHHGCHKRAGYETPQGFRCFGHVARGEA